MDIAARHCITDSEQLKRARRIARECLWPPGDQRWVIDLAQVAGERFQRGDFQENSFSYLLSSKIVPYLPSPTNTFNQNSVPITTNRFSLAANMAVNLYDVQLKFRWPVTKVQTGNSGRPDIQYRVGKYEKVFRTLVSGRLLSTNGFPFLQDNDSRIDVPLYYFNSKDYTAPAL